MAVRLLAAALYGSQTVIAQRQVAAKNNEIPAFAPLLARFDLRTPLDPHPRVAVRARTDGPTLPDHHPGFQTHVKSALNPCKNFINRLNA